MINKSIEATTDNGAHENEVKPLLDQRRNKEQGSGLR